MKPAIKQQLSRLGLLPYCDLIRRLPEITNWIGNGCTGVAPPPVKRLVVSSQLKRFGIYEFIEMGTHLGYMQAYIAYNKSIKCTSIELSKYYYAEAKLRFASYPNVTLLHGDSSAILPQSVHNLQAPALFWLDGHYSGGTTARGEFDTPVSVELSTILDSPIKANVILIDGARCFNGSNTYPYLDNLIKESAG